MSGREQNKGANEMKIKLVTDCSSNICKNITMDIAYVPMKIITDEKEYIDTPELDVQKMLDEMKAYKGKSHSGCPGVQDWLDAFGDSDIVYALTITSGLSGSYNSAMAAASAYLEQKPDAKVYVQDSLSAGPELELILEKYQSLIEEGREFDDVCAAIKDYSKHTHIVFALESLDNFAKNGRVSAIVAKAAGLLGLRVVCTASEIGTIEPVHKCKGQKRTLSTILDMMHEQGYNGGKVRISHCNEAAANEMMQKILGEYPEADISITPNRGLCSFYAEDGGVLVGFEDSK